MFVLSSGDLPTSRAASQDQFADLIINEDDQTVGEGAEPPTDPKRKKKQRADGRQEELMAGRDGVRREWGACKIESK